MLVAKASPAICIFVNLTNSMFKVILSNIAIIVLKVEEVNLILGKVKTRLKIR